MTRVEKTIGGVLLEWQPVVRQGQGAEQVSSPENQVDQLLQDDDAMETGLFVEIAIQQYFRQSEL